MLAQTVRSNLKDINNLKMRTKSTKFSSLFQTIPVQNDVKQVLMKEGLLDVSKNVERWEEIVVKDEEPVVETLDIAEELDIVEEDDELYEIVEDTTQVIVKFPVTSTIKLEEKLPFFKSVSLKLARL